MYFLPYRGQLLDKGDTSDGSGNSLQIDCAEKLLLQFYSKSSPSVTPSILISIFAIPSR